MLIINKNKKTDSSEFKKSLGALYIPIEKDKLKFMILSDNDKTFDAIEFVLESEIQIFSKIEFVAEIDNVIISYDFIMN